MSKKFHSPAQIAITSSRHDLIAGFPLWLMFRISDWVKIPTLFTPEGAVLFIREVLQDKPAAELNVIRFQQNLGMIELFF